MFDFFDTLSVLSADDIYVFGFVWWWALAVPEVRKSAENAWEGAVKTIEENPLLSWYLLRKLPAVKSFARKLDHGLKSAAKTAKRIDDKIGKATGGEYGLTDVLPQPSEAWDEEYNPNLTTIQMMQGEEARLEQGKKSREEAKKMEEQETLQREKEAKDARKAADLEVFRRMASGEKIDIVNAVPETGFAHFRLYGSNKLSEKLKKANVLALKAKTEVKPVSPAECKCAVPSPPPPSAATAPPAPAQVPKAVQEVTNAMLRREARRDKYGFKIKE